MTIERIREMDAITEAVISAIPSDKMTEVTSRRFILDFNEFQLSGTFKNINFIHDMPEDFSLTINGSEEDLDPFRKKMIFYAMMVKVDVRVRS